MFDLDVGRVYRVLQNWRPRLNSLIQFFKTNYTPIVFEIFSIVFSQLHSFVQIIINILLHGINPLIQEKGKECLENKQIVIYKMKGFFASVLEFYRPVKSSPITLKRPV